MGTQGPKSPSTPQADKLHSRDYKTHEKPLHERKSAEEERRRGGYPEART